MAEVTIVRLTPDEWAACRDVRLAALAEAPYAFGSLLAREEAMSEADWRARLQRRSTFVARTAAGLVGTAAGIRGETPGHAELVGMWVHPAWRRHGVGNQLVSAVIGWATDQGHQGLDLWVAVGNDAAEALYARLGFVRTGATQPIREEEPDRLELEMTLPL